MLRPWLWLLISGLLTAGCGPDRRECTGKLPSFVVELKLRDRPLSPDTLVHVTYGGSGKEDYRLAEQGVTHEVVFCHPGVAAQGTSSPQCKYDLDAGLGAAGAPGDDSVQSVCCELWTGGFAKLEVSATGLSTMSYDLSPREHECTVAKGIVLDSPDGG